ncbi:MAG: hypothetical protein AAF289_15940 [Cyanobacteria bacterium P01_A01_bin.135]
MALSEIIQDKAIRNSIADDCTQLIDRQVSAKSGLGGMALKATYSVVKSVGAGYIPGAIQRLLPEVCAALDPLWEEGGKTGNPVQHLSQNRSQAAEAILAVTDRRAEKTSSKVVRSSYNKLRNSVKGDVEAAVPEVAQILGRHALVS